MTQIPALTGLRGVAALWVFFFHAKHVLDAAGGGYAYQISKVLGAGGYLGVDVFFVLSGFVLAHNYALGANSASGYASFIWKRFARVYPAHIAALVLFGIYVLSCIALDLPLGYLHHLTLENLLQTLTLTQVWSLPVNKYWNTVSWSISAEFAAYLCFPVIATMVSRLRSVAAGVTVLALLFLALFSQVNFGIHSGTMSYAIPRIAVEFSAGLLLHRIWVLVGCEQTSKHNRGCLLALAVLIAGANWIDTWFGESTSLPYFPALACALVYLVAASRGTVVQLLSSGAMDTAGKWSYSFYLVHAIFLGVARAAMIEYGLYAPAQSAALILAALLGAILCAGWVYNSVEEPARRFLLRFTPHGGPRGSAQNCARLTA